LALGGVDAEAAVDPEGLAVGEAVAQPRQGAAPHGDRQDRVAVAEGEVGVAAADEAQVGDLALDPQRRELLLDAAMRAIDELADGEDVRGDGGHETSEGIRGAPAWAARGPERGARMAAVGSPAGSVSASPARRARAGGLGELDALMADAGLGGVLAVRGTRGRLGARRTRASAARPPRR